MRFLFLSDAVFEDLPGGSRTVARELAFGLAARGHEITFLVPRHSEYAPADSSQGGIRIVRYCGAGRAGPFLQAGYMACQRLWAEAPYDVVHSHFAYAAVGPLRALPRAVPHLRTFHGPWDEEGWVAEARGRHWVKAFCKKQLRRQVEKANLRRAALVAVLSQYSAQYVQEHYGIPRAHVRIIPGGADGERFAPARRKAEVRLGLGWPLERRILLSVRRLTRRMGLDSLIAAMPAIIAHHPEVLLLIGGQGAERERLEHLVRELRLEQHVRLIGFISEACLAAHYQAADLFVLPSTALEGFGLVTIEALSCGLPVIGTPSGATSEILNSLDARFIAAAHTPEALAMAINGCLESDLLQRYTPDQLHQFVRQRYTWEMQTDAFEKIYADL